MTDINDLIRFEEQPDDSMTVEPLGNSSALNSGLATLPTRKDIEQLALHDPILMQAMKLGADQNLSWEDIMMFTVKCMAERNKETLKTLVKFANKYGVPCTLNDVSG
jgi:hypothetical protein